MTTKEIKAKTREKEIQKSTNIMRNNVSRKDKEALVYELKRLYKPKSLTIGEFRMTFSDYNFNPKGQRKKVEKTYKKAQGIIRSIMRGRPFGEVCVTHDGEIRIGGHRCRAIKDFIENKFVDSDSGLYFRELDEDTKNFFLATDMNMQEFIPEITPVEVADACRDEGKATAINEAENLNFQIGTEIDEVIRSTVNYSPQYKSIHHDLYKSTQSSPDEDPVFLNLKDNNDRHKLELNLARIYFLTWQNEGLTAVKPFVDCLRMYEDETLQKDKKAVEKLRKQVKRILDTLYDFSQINILKTYEYNWFYRFLIKKNFDWGSWEWKNEDSSHDFYQRVKIELNKFYDQKPADDDIKEMREAISPFDEGKTFGQQLKSGLTEYKDTRVVNWTVDVILNAINISEYIILKDPTRLFTPQERESQWNRQMGRCFITGKKIKISDCHAAHIIAHSNRGRTEPENMVMVTASHNTKMGGVDLVEYLKIYKKEGNEISDMAEELIKTGKKV